MNELVTNPNPNYLVDTGVFIAWARGEKAALVFFRHPPGRIYSIPSKPEKSCCARISGLASYESLNNY